MAEQTGRLRRISETHLVLAADLAGTWLFAFQGGGLGHAARLDVFGIAVLALVMSLGGGVIRDVLIGDTPPVALRDLRYGCIGLFGAACALVWIAFAGDIPFGGLVVPDAMGLGFFAIAGTVKALQHGIRPAAAPVLGTITGVGGGITRDLLLSQVPLVLRADIYATAALTGSVLLVLLRRAGVPKVGAALLGGGACVALRVVSARMGWQLPGGLPL